MFWKKKQVSNHGQKLSQQTIGGQSVLFRLFKEALKVDPSKVRKMELTYFALTVTSLIYLQFGTSENKEADLDRAASEVILKSLPSSGESLDFNEAVEEYRKRYTEYGPLIIGLFKESDTPNPSITLLMCFYERVTRNSASGQMIRIAAAGKIIFQYVVDQIDFVKNIVNN